MKPILLYYNFKIMKRIDIEVLKNILKELKAFNKQNICLSDVGFYLKISHKDIKAQMPLIETNFKVERLNRKVMVGLR